MAKDLAISESQTVNLTQKHIRGRLAESLITLKQTYGLDEDGATIAMYMAREDLANMSNMTTSNAIRTLSQFAMEGLIALDGRKIQILDEEELEECCTDKYKNDYSKKCNCREHKKTNKNKKLIYLFRLTLI